MDALSDSGNSCLQHLHPGGFIGELDAYTIHTGQVAMEGEYEV
jgi:hypothetical protein